MRTRGVLSTLDSRSIGRETREGRSVTAARWRCWRRRGPASRPGARTARLASAVALQGRAMGTGGVVALDEGPPARSRRPPRPSSRASRRPHRSASDTAISRSVSSRVFERLGRPPLSSPPLIASRQAARSAASVGHDVKGMARASSTFRHERPYVMSCPPGFRGAATQDESILRGSRSNGITMGN